MKVQHKKLLEGLIARWTILSDQNIEFLVIGKGDTQEAIVVAKEESKVIQAVIKVLNEIVGIKDSHNLSDREQREMMRNSQRLPLDS